MSALDESRTDRHCRFRRPRAASSDQRTGAGSNIDSFDVSIDPGSSCPERDSPDGRYPGDRCVRAGRSGRRRGPPGRSRSRPGRPRSSSSGSFDDPSGNPRLVRQSAVVSHCPWGHELAPRGGRRFPRNTLPRAGPARSFHALSHKIIFSVIMYSGHLFRDNLTRVVSVERVMAGCTGARGDDDTTTGALRTDSDCRMQTASGRSAVSVETGRAHSPSAVEAHDDRQREATLQNVVSLCEVCAAIDRTKTHRRRSSRCRRGRETGRLRRRASRSARTVYPPDAVTVDRLEYHPSTAHRRRDASQTSTDLARTERNTYAANA